jgi:diguanylate cyclase (GGDEF)-like protein/PAS domain S-box-containing protein
MVHDFFEDIENSSTFYIFFIPSIKLPTDNRKKKPMEPAVILIIDDDPRLRKTLDGILKAKGFQTVTARNGAEGLLLMQTYAVDLALIDLGLPDMSGLDVLSRIKVDHPAIAVIILTGNATLESAIEATNRGAFSYLVKPYEIEQLMLQIKRAIEKQQADAALRESETKFRNLMESAPDGMMIVNDERNVVLINRKFEAIFGYDRSEVIGRNMAMFIPPRYTHHQKYSKEYLKNPQAMHMTEGRETFALHRDGSEIPVEIRLSPLKTPEGFIVLAAIRDVTERKHYEAQLEYLTTHDGLTNLPNRNLLIDRLSQAILYAKRNQRKAAVLFIDLDNFKVINDSLGHDLGDRLLKIIGERLTICVRANDTVARQGGDEFVIVLTDLAESEDAGNMAEKIQVTLNQPLQIDQHTFGISCSIGISIYPKDGKDAQALLKNADAAMFRVKEQGRAAFQFFTAELNNSIVERMTMENGLRRALDNNELSVHYQPQVDLASGKMIGLEALLRWQSPELGMVSPARFIPLAEETGLIIPIGEWVLKTAVEQNKIWQAAGFPPLTMAVNLSPRQFWYPGLIETVSKVLSESGLEPRYLELEITEGLVMRDVESALTMLDELKKLGVLLAMDDFGTGYSSLSHLKRFPFDKLKMDISFVREVTSDPGSAAIAKTIIALAHNLNLRVIAEGIETKAQLSYLRDHGCDEMQGFYFSRPIPAAEIEQLLWEEQSLNFSEIDSSCNKMTLLLVDDEPLVLKALERVLSEDGYQIFSTSDTSKGFELLAVNQVGVVLCDLRMPGMSGNEFLGRVKGLHPHTIRIALSGDADMNMVADAINQGAIYKFLNKPISNELLRYTIKKAFVSYKSATGYK